MIFNAYKSYQFKHNPLPQTYINQIQAKEQDVLQHMQDNFGFIYRFPIIITDKVPGRLYGLTSYENGKIKIFLNKKVMQESMPYMISDVIPHEYAHALLFKLHQNVAGNGGHSRLWQETCKSLGGKNCRRYVDQKEIIMSKMPFK
ncbi:SprT-like domain-containing protein [Sulfurimonas sediminis]|uniref:SprT-like domain-containing protein n=1 Tax=Sulfurimonas sediminis TaxID=2590020 RepID=UPI001D053E55|nr:SprT-like domain-containing protein [Sulfurimonas sediminis]